ncbi:sugar carrier protein C-like [Mercurialis annua]|uniref:sugar carrier protein C-like n=1 Tax=Mercurialis annua TaxID=3986 RepID=UPI0021608C28|nr:sugar carrier protein C-like [Mercurialis annua]
MAPFLKAAVSSGDDKPNYSSKITWHAVFTCVVAAMGGLIFGYDIGISGGVTTMVPFLTKFFPSVYHKEALDTSTNQYCKFNDHMLTLFTSSLYVAALFASLAASWVTRKLGRKISMLLGGLIFLAGGAINAAAQAVWMLILGRILLGIGVGFSIQSVPLYVSEMAPYKSRGLFTNVFQLAITIGIFFANLVNYVTPKLMTNGEAWRVCLGLACVPAAFIFISALFLPNTPNSMLEKGQDKEAKEILKRIRGAKNDDEIEYEYQDLVAACKEAKKEEHSYKDLLKRQYRPHLVMAILIPFFQQLTGINVVMFYAPVLFQSIGLGSNASLLSALVTGGVNLVATSIAIYGTDKWGRRFLFLEGGIQMLIFQVLLAVLIGVKFGTAGQVTDLPTWYVFIVVICICIFVAGFAWSWGPLGWLVPSEIFPLEIRSTGQSVVVAVNMIFTFLVAQLFLAMLCTMKFGLFIFFAVFVLLMTVFIYFFLPETKNIPIEEMSQVWKNHWYWRRFMPQDDEPLSV